jgi:uncharacterized membrane protein
MMTALYLGLLAFGLPHLFSMLMPAARDALKARIGEGAYKGLYTLLSLAGVVGMGIGYWHGRAGPAALDMVYEPLLWARHITITLALLGWILIAASHGKSHIKAWIKNPMSWGFALWSLGHLLVNGETAVVYIFGLIFALAVLDIILSTVRGTFTPFEPRIRSDVIAVVAGTVVFLALSLGFHPWVLNIPVLG